MGAVNLRTADRTAINGRWSDPLVKESVFLWDIKEWHQADDYQHRYQMQLSVCSYQTFLFGNL